MLTRILHDCGAPGSACDIVCSIVGLYPGGEPPDGAWRGEQDVPGGFGTQGRHGVRSRFGGLGGGARRCLTQTDATMEPVDRPTTCFSVRCNGPPVKRDVPTLAGRWAFGTRRDRTTGDSGEHGYGFGGNQRGADRPEQTVGGSQSARGRVARFSFAGSARPRRIPSAAQSPVGEPFIELWGTAMLPSTKAQSRVGRLLTGHAVFRGDGAMAAPCPAAGKMPHRERFVCRRADDPVSRTAVPFADRDRRRLDTRRGA